MKTEKEIISQKKTRSMKGEKRNHRYNIYDNSSDDNYSDSYEDTDSSDDFPLPDSYEFKKIVKKNNLKNS
jgi:hypothetical protein